MKWSVIGAGGIADRRVIPAIMKDGKSELAAIFDRTPSVAERIGKKYSVPYFTDAEKMLRSVDCDAVYIATPVFCHKSDALLALSYGKHVLLEKPIALDAKDGAEIVDSFRKANRFISVGYMMRFHCLHEKAREIVLSGGIGKVNSVRMHFSCWYPEIENAWRQNKKQGGGGAVMDLGVHCLELAEHLLGDEIAQVKSFYDTRTFSYEVEDGAVVIFRTKSGILGQTDVNFNVPDCASESRLEIYGDGGYVICDGTLGQEEKGTLFYLHAPQADYSAIQSRTAAKPLKFVAGGGDLYLKQLNDFTACVDAPGYDYFYADRAVRIQQIVDKIYAEKQ